ncbi:hypothetical protein PACTADRAFT_1963 [Pachysolen tannophilus NRRL Y-2460]|uniref:Aminopeptidase n=1 Tax=Pachysolen tannophilus NRRL Y-2460 TaxID=669874 RepID=A0A1E4U070_PACTA|nr:hypothetical protein PACTADRAFT_1963 [Pachysolen tannophilus NRRL Y-2460]
MSSSIDELPLVLANAFLPSNYKLDLEFTPTRPNFSGHLILDLVRNGKYVQDRDDEFSLSFDCSNIVITNALFISEGANLSEKAKVSYDRVKERVKIFLDSSFNNFSSLQDLQIDLKYMGKIKNILTFKDTTSGVFSTNYLNGVTGKADNYVISTHCQPKYAKLIFPCIDELTNKSTFQLNITTDPSFTCLSNSLVENVEILQNDNKKQKLVKFKKTLPMATSIFGFTVGNLDYVEKKVNLINGREIPIRVYTTIGELSEASYALNIVSLALPILESMIHHPFPLDKLDFVALPFLSDAAMENWGLIQIQKSYLLIDPDLIHDSLYSKQTMSIREVVVHELVHQWVGNLITFDEWNHIWLNESFATWLAYSCLQKLNLDEKDCKIWEYQSTHDLQSYLDNDSLPSSNPIFVKHSLKIITTQDALDNHSYHKGIFLLRMLGNLFSEKNDDDFDSLLQIIGNYLNVNQFKTIKPTDLWKFITESPLNTKKYDVSTFMHSWTRNPGFPIIKVSSNAENKVHLEQHRYLYGILVENTDLEDVPYHVPVTCKLSNGSIVRQLLVDRKLDLDLPSSELISLNPNYSNILRVQYQAEFYQNVSSAIKLNKLKTLDLVCILNDLSKLIAQEYQAVDDILGIFEILDALNAKTAVLEFNSLEIALKILQNITSAIVLVSGDSNKDLNNKLEKWQSKFISSLIKKLWSVHEIDYSKLTTVELNSRNELLMMSSKICPNESNQISKKLFKNLIHGPKSSVPPELLNSILTSVMKTASQKEYKEILALAKSPGTTVNNIIERPDHNAKGSIQTAAVLSLGYTTKPDLVLKTLNFVMTNIDTKLIELALIGLTFQKDLKNKLWDWYHLHFDSWFAKSLREGSDYSTQLRATLSNITKLVFGIMINDKKDLIILEKFVGEKTNSKLMEKFKLDEIFEEIKLANEEKIKLNSANDELLKWLNEH